MSNEMIYKLREYINRNKMVNVTAEDRQLAYERGIDFLTDIMLAIDCEEKRNDRKIQARNDFNETERLKKKNARLSLCVADINTPMARLDFFFNYCGCSIHPIDRNNKTVSCAGRILKEVKATYNNNKATGIKVDGINCGYRDNNFSVLDLSLMVISAPQSIFEKTLKKHGISAPAITIEFEDGRKGGIWQNQIGASGLNYYDGLHERAFDYRIDGLQITHDIILTMEDKLTIDTARLDDDGKLKSVPSAFLATIRETMKSSEAIKRAMIMG